MAVLFRDLSTFHSDIVLRGYLWVSNIRVPRFLTWLVRQFYDRAICRPLAPRKRRGKKAIVDLYPRKPRGAHRRRRRHPAPAALPDDAFEGLKRARLACTIAASSARSTKGWIPSEESHCPQERGPSGSYTANHNRIYADADQNVTILKNNVTAWLTGTVEIPDDDSGASIPDTYSVLSRHRLCLEAPNVIMAETLSRLASHCGQALMPP